VTLDSRDGQTLASKHVMKTTTTHVKDGQKVEITLDLDLIQDAVMENADRFGALVSLAKTAALHRLGDNWKSLTEGKDGTDWLLETLDSVNAESVRITAADKKAAESLFPRVEGASPEKLAAAGKALGFPEPLATTLDGLTRQFAKKRIAEANAALDAAKDIL
jgi:hypothetical protein